MRPARSGRRYDQTVKLKLTLGLALAVVLAAAGIRTLKVRPHTAARPELVANPILPADAVAKVPPVAWTPLRQEGTDVPKPKRLDIAELRAGVRAGDPDRVADVVGEPAPEDAEDLFMLIAEIPGDASNSDRKSIIKRLMKLLRNTPGEESSLLLLHSLRRDGFIPFSEWIRVVNELAKRKHPATYAYLESVAFSSEGLPRYSADVTRANVAAELLLKKDSEKYVPAVVQRIRDSSGQVFSGYLDALASVSESANPDIGKLVPYLQERYRDPQGESHDRTQILEVVTDYALGSKSEALRRWVREEIASAEFTFKDDIDEELTKLTHELLLSRLELAGW